jgi:CBS-domain-containing membrane protein
MSVQCKQVQTLPIHFGAPDLENKTKPMALVACPRHDGEQRPVAFCGKCGHCRQIAIVSGDVALACDVLPGDAQRAEESRATLRWVHEFTRVPQMCAALDTPISLLVQHLSRDLDELVPVLDLEGMLVGVVSMPELLAALSIAREALGGTVSDLMIAAPRRIRFDAPEIDAIGMFGEDSARYLAVVGAHGKFLGIVCREDLTTHA